MYSEAIKSGFAGMAEIKDPSVFIAKLQKSIKGLNEVDMQKKLDDLGFGDRSMKAVTGLIQQDFNAMKKSIQDAASLTDKMKVTFSGFSAQVNALKGTSTSVLGQMFQPALTPMTKAVNLLNEVASALGDISSNYSQVGKAVTAVSAIGMASAGVYGVGKILKGGSCISSNERFWCRLV